MENIGRKDIWHFFVNNRRFAIISVILICVMGMFSIYNLPKESDPKVDVPIAVVSTIYAGASPEDVEELITNVIENKINSMSGVEEVTSSSRKGMSMIVVQFGVDEDGREKVVDLKNEIDKIKKDLPSNAEEPRVEQVDFNNSPIMIYSLSGPYDLPSLKSMAEDIKKDLEGIAGVSKVEVIGGEDREVRVIIDKRELDKFGIPLSQVTSSIGQANTDIPIGSIETGGEKYTLRFEGRIKGAEEIGGIPVGVSGGIPVFVRDVGTVVDGFEEASSFSFFSRGDKEALPAISLNIYRASGGEILEIGESVEEKLVEARKLLPNNVSIDTVENQGTQISDDLGGLLKTGVETVIIVSLAVLIFVGWREALLSAISIPLSFFITFIVLDGIGYTLNFLTLFSLILALGIMVDAAIVVSDAMNREINNGKTPKQAALRTIDEFRNPLVFGTLTTVFAFLPMILTSGIMGKFIRTIPVTVTIILISSILVAVAILPALAVKWINIGKKEGEPEKKKASYFDKWVNLYEELIRKLFRDNRLANIFLVSIIGLFIFSLSLPITGIMKSTLFPDSDVSKLYISIQELPGTPLERTTEVSRQVEKLLMGNKDVESIQLNVGMGMSSTVSASSNASENKANIIISLKDKKSKPSYELAKDLRVVLSKENFGSATVEVVETGYGPPSGSPVEINITGPSLTQLASISDDYERVLREIKGVRNVDTSIEETNGEFVIEIDRAKAQVYGLTASQVAYALRNAVNGIEATVIRENGNDTDVVVKQNISGDMDKTNKVTMNTLNSITIATSKGEIPLSTFTNSYLHNSVNVISHTDGERIVKVTGAVDSGYTVQGVLDEFKEKVKDKALAPEYEVSFGGEQEDTEKSFADMYKAFLLGIIAIFALLVFEFNSYRQPIFLLLTIPLAIIGILPGLTIAGQSLSFPAIIGIIALGGVVVNHAIILIDRIHANRLSGLTKEEAIVEAGKSRLKPIFLTTIITIVGSFPLAFSSPVWAPIALAMIFGLSFSFVLTLGVVPILYKKFGEDVID